MRELMSAEPTFSSILALDSHGLLNFSLKVRFLKIVFTIEFSISGAATGKFVPKIELGGASNI